MNRLFTKSKKPYFWPTWAQIGKKIFFRIWAPQYSGHPNFVPLYQKSVKNEPILRKVGNRQTDGGQTNKQSIKGPPERSKKSKFSKKENTPFGYLRN